MTNANGKLLPFTPNNGDNSKPPGEPRVLRFYALGRPAPPDAQLPYGLRWVLFSHRRSAEGARANASQDRDIAEKRRALQLRSLVLFEATIRTSPPHPMWRITCAAGRVLERVLNGMQIALLAYYTALGLLAFPLLSNRQWVGGAAMALIGGVFGSLLLTRLRPMRVKDDSQRRPDQPPKVRGIDDLRWNKYGEWRRRMMMRAEEWMRRAREFRWFSKAWRLRCKRRRGIPGNTAGGIRDAKTFRSQQRIPYRKNSASYRILCCALSSSS